LKTPSITLDVTLIHNNNPERVDAMRVVLETLKTSAPKGLTIRFADEVSWQPERLTTLFLERVQWACANAATQYLFFRARSRPTAFSLMKSLVSATGSLLIYLLREIRDAFSKRHFSSRHRQVSRKHSVAWDQFVNSSSSEWLLVLEDDALFTKTGSDGLWEILQEAGQWTSHAPSFILASEGLDLNDLKLTDEDFLAVSPRLNATRFPFTNTAAAYLVNRSMATHLVKTLRMKPGLAYNTIDFLINNLMLRIYFNPSSSQIFCHHANNPPFQNASIGGRYSSLISN
jgi:hypothetical protein